MTEQQLTLARTLYDDAVGMISAQPSYPLLLDQALLGMEFSRALGEDFAVREPFQAALRELRSASDVGPWLYQGATQAGWLAIQLANHYGSEPSGLAPIDDIAMQWIADYPAQLDIDLPMGVLGLGVYALAHPNPAVKEKLTTGVLDVVESRVERDDNGVFVRLADSAVRRADSSAGCRIVGAAHGTAGLVSYLASAALSGTGVAPRAAALLDDAVRWLLAQRVDFGTAMFPHRVELRYAPSRATWCTGDPGIGLALSVAEQATSVANVARTVRRLAEQQVHRPMTDCQVMDGCICHGSAGLVWFGQHVHQRFGTPGALDSVRRWTEQLAEQRAQGHLTYFSPAGMVRNASFLEGDAGVALALLYAATGVRPAWEELVLAKPITGHA